jgi:hypothetical protein
VNVSATTFDAVSCCNVAHFPERTPLVVIIKKQHVFCRHPSSYIKDQTMKKLFATVAILGMISAPVFAQEVAPVAAPAAPAAAAPAVAAPAAAGTAAAGTGFGVAGLSTAAMVGIGAAVAAVAVVASDNNSTTTHH